jgi:hypothetical protein
MCLLRLDEQRARSVCRAQRLPSARSSASLPVSAKNEVVLTSPRALTKKEMRVKVLAAGASATTTSSYGPIEKMDLLHLASHLTDARQTADRLK